MITLNNYNYYLNIIFMCSIEKYLIYIKIHLKIKLIYFYEKKIK